VFTSTGLTDQDNMAWNILHQDCSEHPGIGLFQGECQSCVPATRIFARMDRGRMRV
jgi:hypothetical protein